MDQSSCETILWAEVKDLDFSNPSTASLRDGVLALLCRLIRETDGAGFAVGLDLPAPGTVDTAEAVRRVVAGEFAQAPPPPVPPLALLLWPSTDGLRPAAPPPAFAGWAFDDANKVKRIGPLPRQNAPGAPSLYLFEALDKATAYGAVAFASELTASEPVAPKRTMTGISICLLALLLFGVASFSTIQIGNMGRKNAEEFTRLDSNAACLGNPNDRNDGAKLVALISHKWTCDKNDNTCCSTQWKMATTRTLNNNWLPWIENFRYYIDGSMYCLSWPLIAFMVSIAAILAGAGIVARNSVFAVFVDPQSGRISLSRSQAVCWTILLLGGYATLAMYNIGMAAETRMFFQQFPLMNDSVQGVTTNINELVLFPKMDIELWTLLGVTVGSPFISTLLTNQKRADAQAVDTAAAATAPTPAAAGAVSGSGVLQFKDLFLGTDAKSQGIIDLTRLQNLVITGMLLIAYFQLLFKAVNAIGPLPIILATGSMTTVFPAMPSIDASFLALLALSHGVYLYSKKA
jgi:hypothetical protein